MVAASDLEEASDVTEEIATTEEIGVIEFKAGLLGHPKEVSEVAAGEVLDVDVHLLDVGAHHVIGGHEAHGGPRLEGRRGDPREGRGRPEEGHPRDPPRESHPLGGEDVTLPHLALHLHQINKFTTLFCYNSMGSNRVNKCIKHLIPYF